MTTIPTFIHEMLDAMNVEELKNRLAAYMMADENLVSRPIGVEVRLADTLDRCGRYEVLIVHEDGSEKEVKFRDRHSRLVYIYTLLHPQGYQRRSLRANNFQALRDLFSRIYFGSAEPLVKAIGNDFDHYFSQAVAQSRKGEEPFVRPLAPLSSSRLPYPNDMGARRSSAVLPTEGMSSSTALSSKRLHASCIKLYHIHLTINLLKQFT